MRTQWCLVNIVGQSLPRVTPCDEPPTALKRRGQGGRQYYQAIENVPDDVTGDAVANLFDGTCDVRHLSDKRENKYDLPPEPLQFKQLGLGRIVR